MGIRYFIAITALSFLTLFNARAGVEPVRAGKAKGRIVLSENYTANDSLAAAVLKRFVHETSGAELPVVKTGKYRKGDMVIGAGEKASLTKDGFRIKTGDGILFISDGGGKGSVYGVITLLERYLGITYYSAGCYSLNKMPDISFPDLDFYENPAFRYRQTQCYAFKDDMYRLWSRTEEPQSMFADGLWVHTFDCIMPAAVYGKDHPEYYSFINGKRQPGKMGQWCLTNNDVFEIAAARIDSIFKANPGRDIISVSQNDGNYTNCMCPVCLATDSAEGAVSGNYVKFMNRLAERFPDKQISTLAYLFTMNPPKYVKPLPNVNIMLCDIDCDREAALTDNKSGREFMKAIEGWSKISDNIFVWDYGINFDNYIAPFPNFPILQKNIQIFKDHNVTMHFSQIGGAYGTDFAEMRAYMVSRLMWNPYLNTDSLMRSFMEGYYGDAAPYLYQYEKTLEGALIASGKRLWIYDSPVSHKDGMLNEACRRRYNEYFDKAELAVKDDSARLARVKIARLPLIYSELEIARSEGLPGNRKEITDKLELFDKLTAEYGIKNLNERQNSPAEYCDLFRTRYLREDDKNIARGCSVEWINGPTGGYKSYPGTALTDGRLGGLTYVENWLGWEGCDAEFIIDLGSEKKFSSVETDFLHQLGAWILLPKKVSYYISGDKSEFSKAGEVVFEEDRDNRVKFVGAKWESPQPVSTRYVKVNVEGTKLCPPWHYGIGYPCWFFMDEVWIK